MSKLPAWLKNNISKSINQNIIRGKIAKEINTVCESALCPNRGECFAKGTLTFMILGKICTRQCLFCAVNKNQIPEPINKAEPFLILDTAKKLNLKHIVITSVTRDDLPDQGAMQFAKSIQLLKENLVATTEVLTPDFQGEFNLLEIVLQELPAVFNHNIETVPSLYPILRKKADYKRSLSVLEYAKKKYPNMIIKSGLMVGFGEEIKELEKVFLDLANIELDVLTVGQYLAPSKKHYPVKNYLSQETFDQYKELALQCGIKYVFSGPLVRSSFNALEVLQEARKKLKKFKGVKNGA